MFNNFAENNGHLGMSTESSSYRRAVKKIEEQSTLTRYDGANLMCAAMSGCVFVDLASQVLGRLPPSGAVGAEIPHVRLGGVVDDGSDLVGREYRHHARVRAASPNASLHAWNSVAMLSDPETFVPIAREYLLPTATRDTASSGLDVLDEQHERQVVYG